MITNLLKLLIYVRVRIYNFLCTEYFQYLSIVSKLMPNIQRVIKFSLMHRTTIRNDIMKTKRLYDGTDNFIIGDFLWVILL